MPSAMGHHHRSRREILNGISVLGTGSLLLPALGQRPDTTAPAILRGRIEDQAGKPVAAKIRVVESATSREYLPEKAIKTMPARPGDPDIRRYFYAKGNYEIAVPPGRYRIEVVRGIAHEEAVQWSEVGSGITHVHDFRIEPLRQWRGPGAANWYSGNTHTHYHLEIDEDPDERLRMVPPAEALDISVISYLIRNDAPYITNRYPIGRLPQFSRDGTIMDMGEEARNNRTFGEFGYGHVLFLNIPRAVEPVSTGLLSPDGRAPDFPTLTMLCEQVRGMGGTTIWCHNGSGMEVPVAVALGQVDAYNLADGLDADYQRYYQFLNCGFRLPTSSGTDWWIYDHNRVYAQVEGALTYESWLAAVKAGRTFVSNGPLLDLRVGDHGPGSSVNVEGVVEVKVRAVSRVPFDRLELVRDGHVVAEQVSRDGVAAIEYDLAADHGGWIAARVFSRAKSHGGTRVFAHTGPVYYRVPGTPFRRAEAAGAFIDEIENSVRLIRKTFRFAKDADRATALGRFDDARAAYARLAEGRREAASGAKL
ncbi:MAG: CehA/McbA family metallohydrolase [Bryobacteraceae bacterium]